jgi:hypothetical protein
VLSEVKIFRTGEHLWASQHTMNPVSTLVAEAVGPRPSIDVVLERLEQLEDTRGESSARLHLEIDEVKRRVEALNLLQVDMQVRITRLEAPVEATKIRFHPGVLVAAVTLAVTIMSGLYTILDKIDDIDKAGKLQALEMQTLKEMVIRVQGGQKP